MCLFKFKVVKIEKIEVQLQGLASHISGAPKPRVASGYCWGQRTYKTLPSEQKVLPDSTATGESVCQRIGFFSFIQAVAIYLVSTWSKASS